MDALTKINIEQIHKRFADSHLHSLHSQMVMDVQKLKDLGKNIPICNELINDLSKPCVNKSNLKLVYAGILCIIGLLLDEENANRNDFKDS
jgi:hypothetical protein